MDFHGVKFGMAKAEAIARLRAHARERGEALTLVEYTDPEGAGGSVHLEGPTWTYAFSEIYDEVWGHMCQWRKTPAGREASVAWIAGRVAAYGPPDCVAVLAPRQSLPVEALLEWSTADGRVAVDLRIDDGAWNVREDHDAHRLERSGHVAIAGHLERLGRLRERLARQPEQPAAVERILEQMRTWVRARHEVLTALAPLLPGVGMIDFDAIGEASRMLDRIDAGLSEGDGAFLVIRRPLTSQLDAVHNTLLFRNGTAAPHTMQLTMHPGIDHEPHSREPLPPPPDELVLWVEGPLAVRVLHDALHGADPRGQCEVVPASFVTVDGAIEAWPRVPPPADPRGWSRKYVHIIRDLRPLRLTDPRTGESVYLNRGESADLLRRYAHALLAARLAGRR